MSQTSNLDMKAIAFISTAAIGGLLIGTFLIAPMIAKHKAKKMDKQKAMAAKKG